MCKSFITLTKESGEIIFLSGPTASERELANPARPGTEQRYVMQRCGGLWGYFYQNIKDSDSMSYTVLARKYRPRRFEDIVGQEHVSKSLQNAVVLDQVGHAYLLTGTRGIGKTTAARIFAKALTCENLQENGNPCLECNQCLSMDNGSSIDVSEMDGASNNGVDNVRALVENIQYLPTKGKYKVYIIDEVHMLSTAAFNALLKTLEEPPKHVIFILATTDPEKLLHTVLSRCQRFDFRNATTSTLSSHLNHISGLENIKFENSEMVMKIAKMAKGSFRDALSLVDQVLSYAKDRSINEETFTFALGIAKTSSIKDISNSILKGDTNTLQKVFRQCVQENVDLKNLSLSLLDYFFFVIEKIDNAPQLYDLEVLERGVLDDISAAEIFWLYENLAKDLEWSLTSIDPEKVTELVLKKVALRREFFSNTANEATLKKNSSFSEELIAPQESPKEIPEEDSPEDIQEINQKDDLEINEESPKSWEGFLNFLNSGHQVLRANLEQGNLLGDWQLNDEGLYMTIAFDESVQVFYDYLMESSVLDRVRNLLSEYFETPLSKVHFEIENLTFDQKEEKNFKSISEKKDEEDYKKREEAKQKVETNEFIKQAEDIFQARVDKIILNPDNK